MDLKKYKIDEEILSPERFPLDEIAHYFRQGDQAIKGELYENDAIDSLPALSNIRRGSR